jgi:hypothetical protein
MLARAVFSEGDAARPITASQPPGAHAKTRACTHKSAFYKRGSINVRFAPKATEVLRCRKASLCANSCREHVQQRVFQK